jgi:hypothetical protein
MSAPTIPVPATSAASMLATLSSDTLDKKVQFELRDTSEVFEQAYAELARSTKSIYRTRPELGKRLFQYLKYLIHEQAKSDYKRSQIRGPSGAEFDRVLGGRVTANTARKHLEQMWRYFQGKDPVKYDFSCVPTSIPSFDDIVVVRGASEPEDISADPRGELSFNAEERPIKRKRTDESGSSESFF